MIAWLARRLMLPQVRHVHPDAPELVAIHGRVIRHNPFLRALYRDHYRRMRDALGPGRREILELG